MSILILDIGLFISSKNILFTKDYVILYDSLEELTHFIMIAEF